MQITYLTPELTLQDRVTNTMMTMIMMMIRMMRIMIVAVLYDLSAYTRNCGNFFFLQVKLHSVSILAPIGI